MARAGSGTRKVEAPVRIAAAEVVVPRKERREEADSDGLMGGSAWQQTGTTTAAGDGTNARTGATRTIVRRAEARGIL
jgi:hypothetical protein